MSDPRKTAPPAADPKAGRNPGYAESHPRDREDAHHPAARPVPNPDDPGIGYDADAPPDPADGPRRH